MIASLAPRADYPTLEDSVYLNQAALGILGRPAVEAMHGFLDEVARHGNLSMSDRDEIAYVEALRERAARLLSVDGDHTAILGSASELLGQLPFLLEPERGSAVLVVATDFPAVTRPWLRLAELRGCELRFVEDSPEQDLTTALIDALDKRTSIVAVGHVQYATGTVLDIDRLRDATRQVGASLVVDASQSAGAIGVDASAWDAEVVVASGYKWLGGHGGVAVAAVSPRLLQTIPQSPGWMGAPQPFEFEATKLRVASTARRFTQATMSYISMAGLAASMDQLLAWGFKPIEAHARALSAVLVSELAGSGWVPFRSPDEEAASPHIVSLAHPAHSPASVTAALAGRGIVCGARGGRVRVSLALYNDEGDVRALVEALAGVG